MGESNLPKVVKAHGLEMRASLQTDPELAKLSDKGKVELYGKIHYTFSETFGSKVEDMLTRARKTPKRLPVF